MRYVIIGLGIYGGNLAVDLTKMGHEVIGADSNPSVIEAIKDYISAAYIVDSTDETALSMLPLKNVDLVIVAIGENFGASIRTVALLKKMGVKHIFARAIDKLHKSILDSFNLDRIVTPEQRAATDLVNEMELGSDMRSIRLVDDFLAIRFTIPKLFVGMTYKDLQFDTKYGLTIIGAARAVAARNMLGISHTSLRLMKPDEFEKATVEESDIILCTGSVKAFRGFYRSING